MSIHPFIHVAFGICLCVVTTISYSAVNPEVAVTDSHVVKDDYTGSKTCADCHRQAYQQWQQSHHARAMAPAGTDTVLGNFSGQTFNYAGTTTRFYRKGAEYWLTTAGPNGKPADYRIEYTFGWFPLQQYVIAFANGHYQVLSIAWDSRAATAGGQRWFHLYPEDNVTHDNPLHWTGPYHKWNNRCGECHTTGFSKNYRYDNDSYATTWKELGIGCEGCHGPGAAHIAWARAGASSGNTDLENKGLAVSLASASQWSLQQGPIAVNKNTETDSNGQVELCAACHSRRTVTGHWQPGDNYLDRFVPELLTHPSYHADGQIRDEVFEIGSFWQSKMFHAGVVCSDCHEPHSDRLRAEGNGVCLQCHQAATYNVTAHHHHQANAAGAQCVSCHLPEQTYMVVDDRRDHSIRIPNPGLSINTEIPNACNQCHSDQSPTWAVQALQQWGYSQAGAKSTAGVLSKANHYGSETPAAIRQLALDNTAPAITRATAYSLLTLRSEADISLLRRGLSDTDALVRLGAVRAFNTAPPPLLKAGLFPVLNDPVKAVRLEATKILSALPANSLTADERKLYQSRLSDYIAAQLYGADFAGSWLNLAGVYLNQHHADQSHNALRKAETAYQQALKREPALVPAMLNLADLYRIQGKEELARPLIERAMKVAPEDSAGWFSYGLFLVRAKDYRQALVYLKRAAELAPETAHYSYVYAVALQHQGQIQNARAVVIPALKRHPDNTNLQRLRDSLDRSAPTLTPSTDKSQR